MMVEHDSGGQVSFFLPQPVAAGVVPQPGPVAVWFGGSHGQGISDIELSCSLRLAGMRLRTFVGERDLSDC